MSIARLGLSPATGILFLGTAPGAGCDEPARVGGYRLVGAGLEFLGEAGTVARFRAR